MYFTEKGLLEGKHQELSVKVCLISGTEVDLLILNHHNIAKLKEEALDVLEVVSKEKTVLKSNKYRLLHVHTGRLLDDEYIVGLVLANGDELLLVPRRSDVVTGSATDSLNEPTTATAASLPFHSDTNLTRQQSTPEQQQRVPVSMSVDVGVSGPKPNVSVSMTSDIAAASPNDNANKSPSKRDIAEATSHLTPIHDDRRPKEHLKSLDFTSELQKILVTFVETSLRLLAMDPNAEDILREIGEKVACTSKTAEAVAGSQASPASSMASKFCNPQYLQKLVEMGFTERQAHVALRKNNNNINDASEWLLKHIDDDDDDDGLMDLDLVQVDNGDDKMETDTTTSTHTHTDESDEVEVLSKYNIPIHTGTILKACKEYQRAKFKPNEAALQHFKEMGFDESSILDALREAGNNEDLACDMLLGERCTVNYESLTGLDTSHSVYKSIMSNPIILSHLSNPKNLLVFLSMLENLPNIRSSPWVAEPDMSPLFSQVFRVYHTENYQLKLCK